MRATSLDKNVTKSAILTKQGLFYILCGFLAIFLGMCLHIDSLVANLPGLDESAYLWRGAVLVERLQFHALAWNPTASSVNGLLYLLMGRERLLLEKVSTVRRVLSFVVILVGTWRIGHLLLDKRGALLLVLLVGVSKPIGLVMANTSEALYTAFAVLACGATLRLVNGFRKQLVRSRDLIAVGMLLSFAAMARIDGLVTALLLLPAIMILHYLSYRSMGKAVVAGGHLILAFVLWPLVWTIATGVTTGNWSLELSKRSYIAFAQGQNVLFAGSYLDKPDVPTAEEVFGNARENRYSILRAALSNPRGFLRRLKRIPRNAFGSMQRAYGYTLFPMLILVAPGLWWLYLSQRPQTLVVSTFIVPIVFYTFTFYRPGYFAMQFPFVCTLVAVILTLPFSFFMASGRDQNLSANHKKLSAIQIWSVTTVSLLLLLNFIYGWRNLSSYINRDWRSADRKWITNLSHMIPKGSCVVAFDPSQLWYAGLEHHRDWGLYRSTRSPDQLLSWMRKHHCPWLIIDDAMRSYDLQFVEIVMASRPTLQTVFEDLNQHRSLLRLVDP